MKLVFVANLLLDNVLIANNPRVAAVMKGLEETCDKDTVLIVLGNVGLTKASIRAARTVLANLPCSHKLYVAGRYDLQALDSRTKSYESILQQELTEYGFHLLDHAPYIIENHVFVGNIAWYDGTLWTVPSDTWPIVPAWPRIRTDAAKGWNAWFATHLKSSQDELTSNQFFHRCQSRLRTHLDSMVPILSVPENKLVVCTNSMPAHSLFTTKYTPKEHYNRYAAGWIPQAGWVKILSDLKAQTSWFAGFNQDYAIGKISLRGHNNNNYQYRNNTPDPNGLKVENVGSSKPLVVIIDPTAEVKASQPYVM